MTRATVAKKVAIVAALFLSQFVFAFSAVFTNIDCTPIPALGYGTNTSEDLGGCVTSMALSASPGLFFDCFIVGTLLVAALPIRVWKRLWFGVVWVGATELYVMAVLGIYTYFLMLRWNVLRGTHSLPPFDAVGYDGPLGKVFFPTLSKFYADHGILLRPFHEGSILLIRADEGWSPILAYCALWGAGTAIVIWLVVRAYQGVSRAGNAPNWEPSTLRWCDRGLWGRIGLALVVLLFQFMLRQRATEGSFIANAVTFAPSGGTPATMLPGLANLLLFVLILALPYIPLRWPWRRIRREFFWLSWLVATEVFLWVMYSAYGFFHVHAVRDTLTGTFTYPTTEAFFAHSPALLYPFYSGLFLLVREGVTGEVTIAYCALWGLAVALVLVLVWKTGRWITISGRARKECACDSMA